MHALHVVTVSTREGRLGPAFATWIADQARAHAKFEVVPVDLKSFNLPVFDEPKHPRLKQYEHEHTKRWSASVEAADALVFVLPEYNHFVPPSFVNAIDYLVQEWAYKAVGFLSYGGPLGGARSLGLAKQLAATMRMVPVQEAVAIPLGVTLVANGVFKGSPPLEKAAQGMLEELHRVTDALTVLRRPGS